MFPHAEAHENRVDRGGRGADGAARAGGGYHLRDRAPGFGFAGPVTEDGFIYSTLSGALFVTGGGNPGQDMEGDAVLEGGVLDIVAAGSPADFMFSGLDYAAFDSSGTGSQTLTVVGLLGGSVVGADNYRLDNTDVSFPTYANWTTELASNLAGKTIDALHITLNAGFPGEFSTRPSTTSCWGRPPPFPSRPPGRCSAAA